MKQLIALVTTLLMSTFCFAGNKLDADTISAAWHAKKTQNLPRTRDITIVYGGADVSSQSSLTLNPSAT